NDGAGGFGAATSYAVGTAPQAVAFGDLNGDSHLDLVTANAGSNTVSVLLNTGAGGFTAAVDYATDNSTSAAALRDLNTDGHADVVTAGGYAASVLLNNGNATFAPAVISWTYYPVGSVAVGDFNQDGNADLALGFAFLIVTEEDGYSFYPGPGDIIYDYNPADYYYVTYYYETDVGVAVLEGSGNGTFGPETEVTTNWYVDDGGEYISSLAVGDFDGAGFPDLAAVESTGYVDLVQNTSPRVGLHMSISPDSATAGTLQSVTVSAFDLAGNPDPTYTGT